MIERLPYKIEENPLPVDEGLVLDLLNRGIVLPGDLTGWLKGGTKEVEPNQDFSVEARDSMDLYERLKALESDGKIVAALQNKSSPEQTTFTHIWTGGSSDNPDEYFQTYNYAGEGVDHRLYLPIAPENTRKVAGRVLDMALGCDSPMYFKYIHQGSGKDQLRNTQVDQLLFFLHENNWQTAIEIAKIASEDIELQPLPTASNPCEGFAYMPDPIWFTGAGRTTPFIGIANQLSLSMSLTTISIAMRQKVDVGGLITKIGEIVPEDNAQIKEFKELANLKIHSVTDLVDFVKVNNLLYDNDKIFVVAFVAANLLTQCTGDTLEEVAKRTPKLFDISNTMGYQSSSIRSNIESLLNSHTIDHETHAELESIPPPRVPKLGETV